MHSAWPYPGRLPRLSVEMTKTVNIGFLAPLSGQVESWGLPGLHGCRIWENWLNNAGGLLIGGRRYPVRIQAYDCGEGPDAARAGAAELVREHDVKLMMMLGGDSFAAVADFLTERRSTDINTIAKRPVARHPVSYRSQ